MSKTQAHNVLHELGRGSGDWRVGVRAWFVRAIDNWKSIAITFVCLFLLARALVPAVDWLIVSAVWSGGDEACRSGGGACWAFIGEKYRLILFGIYPFDEQWRPVTVILLLVGAFVWSVFPQNWNRRQYFFWGIVLISSIIIMKGGMFGLKDVSTENWGGLPLTLILTAFSLIIGFPLSIALALGRESKLPVIRYFSIISVEMIRGLPLLSLLFIVSVMLPIFLPNEVTVDKLARATFALVFYAAAYLSEVVRGGLQGIGSGQREAAAALGLPTWRIYYGIILPQALLNVVPPLTNTVIIAIKNTAFVLVVGLFDLLSAGRVATLDPNWPAVYAETYLFVGAIYFTLCFSVSRYANWLEYRFSR